MTSKKTSPEKQRLVSKPAKTEEELAYEEYLKQLEMAMENH
ncbi:MAG: hypothetical protein ABI347_07300 [Nitrososphaera sp.]|jgi:hypothetical protein